MRKAYPLPTESFVDVWTQRQELLNPSSHFLPGGWHDFKELRDALLSRLLHNNRVVSLDGGKSNGVPLICLAGQGLEYWAHPKAPKVTVEEHLSSPTFFVPSDWKPLNHQKRD